MKIFLLFILLTAEISAQWSAGAAYQVKSSQPSSGTAVYLIKKLPFQFPDIGFNVKGKVSYFFSRQDIFVSRGQSDKGFNEYALEIMTEINFFQGMFKPFTSLGLGGGYIKSEQFNKAYFSLCAQGGLKLYTKVQPYMELQIRHTFTDYSAWGNPSMHKLQVGGALGVLFSL